VGVDFSVNACKCCIYIHIHTHPASSRVYICQWAANVLCKVGCAWLRWSARGIAWNAAPTRSPSQPGYTAVVHCQRLAVHTGRAGASDRHVRATPAECARGIAAPAAGLRSNAWDANRNAGRGGAPRGGGGRVGMRQLRTAREGQSVLLDGAWLPVKCAVKTPCHGSSPQNDVSVPVRVRNGWRQLPPATAGHAALPTKRRPSRRLCANAGSLGSGAARGPASAPRGSLLSSCGWTPAWPSCRRSSRCPGR
jgi:hypothetical protein